MRIAIVGAGLAGGKWAGAMTCRAFGMSMPGMPLIPPARSIAQRFNIHQLPLVVFLSPHKYIIIALIVLLSMHICIHLQAFTCHKCKCVGTQLTYGRRR